MYKITFSKFTCSPLPYKPLYFEFDYNHAIKLPICPIDFTCDFYITVLSKPIVKPFFLRIYTIVQNNWHLVGVTNLALDIDKIGQKVLDLLFFDSITSFKSQIVINVTMENTII